MILAATLDSEAQYVFRDPLENLYLDLYIEQRAHNLYKERVEQEKKKTEEEGHTNSEDFYEKEPEEAVHTSIGTPQEEMETIICYYDRSRQLQCDPYSGEESYDN